MPVFKTGAINHSATLPLYSKYHLGRRNAPGNMPGALVVANL